MALDTAGNPSEKRPFHQGLRFKLLLVSLTLLAIPWAGYRYVTETDSFLRLAQEQVLLGRAEMVASILPSRVKEYLTSTNQPAQQPLSNAFYAHPFEQHIQPDGYPEEWRYLFSQRRRFIASETNPDAIAFHLLLGFTEQTLYLLVQIDDSLPVYATSDADPRSGDHLLIATPGKNGRTKQYVVGSSAPGWVAVYALDSMTPEPAILGEWQESTTGYTIELQLPLKLTGGSISLAMVDKDTLDPREISGRAATSGLRRNANLSLILIPEADIEQLLNQVDKQGVRTRIINRQGLVIGQSGKIMTDRLNNAGGLITRMLDAIFLSEQHLQDKREKLGRLDGPEIRRALQGFPATYRHQDKAHGYTILSAAYPVKEGDETRGAVIIEQTTDEVLLIQQSALERLLSISLVLFMITGISLLFFASRLTGRITRISHKINNAVSGEGRIYNDFIADAQGDEIGDLERSFASVMQRLQEYNRYLEAMAARLSHEFRTPLAMVKSSLENLAQDEDPLARTRYLSRAAEGTERLSLILERMREATRLEQTLQMAEQESVNLTQLLGLMTDNYRSSYPDTAFEHRLPEQPLFVIAAPELIVQALDKLVSNAVDFHTSGTPVVMALDKITTKICRLRVINQGPELPEAMRQQLFDSMISIRDKSDRHPHLGLGLYLVRLIAEFHHGGVAAENTGDGVCFSMNLPLDLKKPNSGTAGA